MHASAVSAQRMVRERRRCPRYPASMPAYVRMNGISRGPSLDLSTVLDISEEGMRVQAPAPLEPARTIAVDLDLAQIQSHLKLIGQVIWADDSGRAGLQFACVDPNSAHQLREWLLLNAVAHLAGPDGTLEKVEAPAAVVSAPAEPVSEELFPDEEDSVISPLQEVTNGLVNRTVAFTGANGAALALYEGANLICRATCGTDTPGLGARISVDSGITGECIRSGHAMICSDAMSDPRVNHEICAQLGIRSILAVPLQVGSRTVGLLEAFSPRPSTFVPLDAEAIRQTAKPALDLIFANAEKKPGAVAEVQEARNVPAEKVEEIRNPLPMADPGPPLMAPAGPIEFANSSMYRRIAYAAAAVMIVLAVGWLVITQGTTLVSLFAKKAPQVAAAPQASIPEAAQPGVTATPQPATVVAPADPAEMSLLKRQAERGDAYAQYSLAAKYAAGSDGLRQDYTEAMSWFMKSAQQGHTSAQATLGAYYWAGRGIPQDLGQAYFWSLLAQAGGDEASKYRLDVLRQRLTSTEIVAEEHRARDWLASHKRLPPAGSSH